MAFPLNRLFALLGVVLSLSMVVSASRADEPVSVELSAEMRTKVIAEMRTILEQTKIIRPGSPPTIADLVRQPVLNWDDLPRGHHYGTLWVWGSQGRPAAIIEMYTVNFAREIGQWPGNVLHSLASKPLTTEAEFHWDWSPEQPGVALQPLPESPRPAATRTARLLQMRSLAKRFSAHQTWQGDRAQLRLLPTPIWRYESMDDHVLDGGLFVFSHGGTNPEVVLVLEAEDTAGQWQFGCVRLGHAEMTAQFDDRDVWSVSAYDEVDPKAPYYWIAKP